MRYDPALAALVAVLAILLWMAAWFWLRFAKYPTDGNRDGAARTTAWALGFGGMIAAYLLVTLGSVHL